ncbi:MAG: ABC transporter substrate-binding protein [Devosia sp.]
MKALRTIAAALALVGLSTAAGFAQDKLPVRIGWLKASLTTIAQAIAEEEQLYDANGLAPTITAIQSGGNATGIEALLRGDFDVYFGAMSELARLNGVALEQGGQPPLAAVAIGTPGATHLVVGNDVPFETVEDLRGLTLGVSSLGSIHLVMFRHYLASQGLTTDSLGLTLLRVGASDMPPALLTGQIDGFLHSQPTPSVAEARGAGKVALAPQDMGEVGLSPTSAIMVRRDWAAANPETVTRVIATFRQASALFGTLPEDRLVAIAQAAIGSEEDLIRRAMTSVNPRLVDDFEAGADVYWRTEISAMKERGELIESFERQHMFDFSYADR